MTEVEMYKQPPRNKEQVINSQTLIQKATTNAWFAEHFLDTADTSTSTIENLLTILRNDTKKLAEFAQESQTYFVGIVKPTDRGMDWLVMPGWKDKEYRDLTQKLYAEQLAGAYAHFIIGPSGDTFANCEDIGVMDADIADCRYAIDITLEDGLAADRLEVAGGKLVMIPDAWVEWGGSSAIGGYYGDFEADPATNQTVRVPLQAGRTALLESLQSALSPQQQ